MNDGHDNDSNDVSESIFYWKKLCKFGLRKSGVCAKWVRDIKLLALVAAWGDLGLGVWYDGLQEYDKGPPTSGRTLRRNFRKSKSEIYANW